MNFELTSAYKPTGDQPEAIAQLTEGVLEGVPAQTLLGVTGSGKTFTIANVIANINKPKHWQPSSIVSLKDFSPIMLSNIMYLIMIITSRRPICQVRIHI